MQRLRNQFGRAIPILAAALAGALLSTSFAGALASGAPAQLQDPALMQLQQQLSTLQLTLQTRFDMMQSEIDAVERDVQDVRYRFNNARNTLLQRPVPTPSDPIPGMVTNGRLVSETAESYRFVLKGAAGGVQAQLGTTSDGPGLVLFNAEGEIAAALLSTPDGPQLRMRDADGNLQTVVPAQQ